MPQVKTFRIGKNGKVFYYPPKILGGVETNLHPSERGTSVSVVIDTNAEFDLLLEDGGFLLLEDGGFFELEV